MTLHFNPFGSLLLPTCIRFLACSSYDAAPISRSHFITGLRKRIVWQFSDISSNISQSAAHARLRDGSNQPESQPNRFKQKRASTETVRVMWCVSCIGCATTSPPSTQYCMIASLFSLLLTSRHTRLWTTRLSPAHSHILGDSSISLINFYFLRLTDMNLPHGSLSHTEECVWVMVCLLFQPLFWFGGCCAFPGRGIVGVWWPCRGRSCRKLLSF